MTMPSDAELAEIYRFTPTRWGIEGAPVFWHRREGDFTCMCSGCLKSRRDRWCREHTE